MVNDATDHIQTEYFGMFKGNKKNGCGRLVKG
jgi:hypothetical protein